MDFLTQACSIAVDICTDDEDVSDKVHIAAKKCGAEAPGVGLLSKQSDVQKADVEYYRASLQRNAENFIIANACPWSLKTNGESPIKETCPGAHQQTKPIAPDSTGTLLSPSSSASGKDDTAPSIGGQIQASVDFSKAYFQSAVALFRRLHSAKPYLADRALNAYDREIYRPESLLRDEAEYDAVASICDFVKEQVAFADAATRHANLRYEYDNTAECAQYEAEKESARDTHILLRRQRLYEGKENVPMHPNVMAGQGGQPPQATSVNSGRSQEAHKRVLDKIFAIADEGAKISARLAGVDSNKMPTSNKRLELSLWQLCENFRVIPKERQIFDPANVVQEVAVDVADVPQTPKRLDVKAEFGLEETPDRWSAMASKSTGRGASSPLVVHQQAAMVVDAEQTAAAPPGAPAVEARRSLEDVFRELSLTDAGERREQ
eukprot:g9650.t1